MRTAQQAPAVPSGKANLSPATTPKKKTSEKIKSFFSVGSSHASPPGSLRTVKSIKSKSFEDSRKRSSSLLSTFALHDGDSSTDSASNEDSELFESVRSNNGFKPSKIIQNYKNQLDKWDQPLLNEPGLMDSDYGYYDNKHYSKFIPKPALIKFVKKSNNTPEIMNRLFLAQDLNQNFTSAELAANPDLVESLTCNGAASEDLKNSVWVMKFNCDGKYLATAGKGNTIKIWKVLATPLDKLQDRNSPDEFLNDSISDKNNIPVPAFKPVKMDTDKAHPSLFAPVFQNNCYRHYIGHEHDILSLDWSKNDFILSSSMDKTVQLWNIKQKQSLRVYQHTDFVTCVKFHPTDDRFFVSGCLDHRVRLWSILDNEVVYEFNARNLVTAVGFTPNGSLVIVGTFTGVLYFLDTQNLELRHSLDLQKTNKNIISITSSNNAHGSSSNNSSCKVTGIESYQDGDDIKIVITANDSKIRLLSLKDRALEFYFKGHENSSSQITANVSDNRKYIISGSENHWTYIWEIGDKDGSESHDDHKENSTSSIKSFLHNKKKRKDYIAFHSNHSVVTAAVIAPTGTAKSLALSNDYIYELNNEYYNNVRPSSSHPPDHNTGLFQPSYIGDIIITADDRGNIRVFRKDIPPEIRERLNNSYKATKKSKEISDYNLQNSNSNSRITITKAANNGSSAVSLLRADSIGQRLFSSANGLLNNSNHSCTTQIADQIPSTLVNLLNIPVGGTSNAMSPQTGRSRSGTVSSIQRSLNDLNTNNIVCDICAGDKFKVMKGESSTYDKGVTVYCAECGNQVNT